MRNRSIKVLTLWCQLWPLGLCAVHHPCPKFNGSHFGLPPSSTYTGWLDWVAKYSLVQWNWFSDVIDACNSAQVHPVTTENQFHCTRLYLYNQLYKTIPWATRDNRWSGRFELVPFRKVKQRQRTTAWLSACTVVSRWRRAITRNV